MFGLRISGVFSVTGTGCAQQALVTGTRLEAVTRTAWFPKQPGNGRLSWLLNSGTGNPVPELKGRIYIYMVTPPHELPTLVLYRKYRVKTAFPAGPDSVSLKNYRKQTQISRERVSQLIHVRREVRILYLLKTTEINLTFQQDVSVNSFRFDVSTQSTATLCPPNQKPTFPRGNQKNQKIHLLRHYAARHQKDFFLVSLGKRWFWTGKPTFC